MRERTLVQLPPDLAQGIDKLVGARNRSSFTAEVVRRELKRREQQEALRSAAGTWKDQDHAELAEGGAAYIEKVRSEEASSEDDRLDQLTSAQNA
jgi:Arc/MetJ-type ribon-helix-helix transcriptional regulator